jgi:hypothetical protein
MTINVSLNLVFIALGIGIFFIPESRGSKPTLDQKFLTCVAPIFAFSGFIALFKHQVLPFLPSFSMLLLSGSSLSFILTEINQGFWQQRSKVREN